MSHQLDLFHDFASRAQVVVPCASSQPKPNTPRPVRRPSPMPGMKFRQGSGAKRPVTADERAIIEAAVHAGLITVCPPKYAMSASPFWSPGDLR